MKWYHFSVEYFEDLRNVNHCEFLIMRKKEDSGKYILENNLRTWSELKRERLAAVAAKEKLGSSTQLSEKDKEKEKKLLGDAGLGISSPIPVRKKWGGCPNGCDHGKHYYKKENSMHAMQQNGKPTSHTSPGSSPIAGPGENLASRRPAARRWQSSSEEEDDPRGRLGPPAVDVQRSLDEVISSPDGTPSFITVEGRLRNHLKSPPLDKNNLLVKGGRDFGGSASGNTSQAGSDTEFSAEEDARKRLANGKGFPHAKAEKREQSGMRRSAMADALGDQVDVGSDAGSEAELDGDGPEETEESLACLEKETLDGLEKAERRDKSLRGSVY
jgi:hypothetical protein